jgi:hypothetical protein
MSDAIRQDIDRREQAKARRPEAATERSREWARGSSIITIEKGRDPFEQLRT